MRQKTVITKLLKSVTEVYYKVRQVLQSATVITKWDVTQAKRCVSTSGKYVSTTRKNICFRNTFVCH